MVSTTSVVRQSVETPGETVEQIVVVTVVRDGGTVDTLSEDEVEILLVVTVANSVAVGVVTHCDMLAVVSSCCRGPMDRLGSGGVQAKRPAMLSGSDQCERGATSECLHCRSMAASTS